MVTEKDRRNTFSHVPPYRGTRFPRLKEFNLPFVKRPNFNAGYF